MQALQLKIKDRPFKTSAFFRGEGLTPLPTFDDLRGVGVSGMPTSAISSFLLNQCMEYLLFPLNHYLEYLIFVHLKKKIAP